ncbi:conserved Plasmodium protein, unknown function [Plasmodium malariae]|uniref:Uncharacterized protein n=1 Tax=Plasmodium malariae TaxID=5858 RepID=A0A1C3KZU6_PLAMA|nr:conserved Plasmodium protein, unknown function [Plasmodium malariae]
MKKKSETQTPLVNNSYTGEKKRNNLSSLPTLSSIDAQPSIPPLPPLNECKKNYIFCKTNNFNNLGGMLIEKNLFVLNFVLSIKYNEEKKKERGGGVRSGGGENVKCAESTQSDNLKMYYLSQNEKVFIDEISTCVYEQGAENDEQQGDDKVENFFEKNMNILIKNNFFFFIKNYIHNILSNVDICTQEKPNETFFEFFSIFKNKKKKIYLENSDDMLSDLYCDVSHASDDSDYNYFYEKTNQMNDYDYDYEEGEEEEEQEEGENEKNNAEEECQVKDESEQRENSLPNGRGNIYLVANLSKNLDLIYCEKRNSLLSIDNEKRKKQKKDKKFEKYLCRCCKTKKNKIKNIYNIHNIHNIHNNYNNYNNYFLKRFNVCLLQIFISNLTKKEFLFWAKIKDTIQHFLGSIQSAVFHKGISNYVEIPYIEIMDEINKYTAEEAHLKFIKKKKKLLILKKEQKSIKCLFEKTINSVRISVKYNLIFADNKFNYLFKDVMKKYRRVIKNNIFNNYHARKAADEGIEVETAAGAAPGEEKHDGAGIMNYANSIHNNLNPNIVKNYTKKHYDFSLLVHNIHLELYGYVYIRNYLFFLLIMIEVYIFIHFNDISYTYSNNTDIFLDQILKNLFT